MGTAKILIVENDTLQRLLYREALMAEGHEVAETDNAKGALLAIEADPPDVVILDIHMPGMDGLEALAAMHDRVPDIRVILHTAYARYQEQYVSWIADAYLVKSSDMDKLCRTVTEVLEKPPLPDSATGT